MIYLGGIAMAKTIKFNLICDNNPIRTIEDLRNHFSIEDVLKYYKNGLLLRWLQVRGYAEEVEQVKNIVKVSNNAKRETDDDELGDDILKIEDLIKIFKIPFEPSEVEDATYNFVYENNKKKDLKKFEENNFRSQLVNNIYFEKYNKLVIDILDNPDNYALIKNNINAIMMDYGNVFDVDYRNLFYALIDKSPLAILRLLMYDRARNKYLDIDNNSELNDESIITNGFAGVMYDNIKANDDRKVIYENIKNRFFKKDIAYDYTRQKDVVKDFYLHPYIEDLAKKDFIKFEDRDTKGINYEIYPNDPSKKCMVLFIEDNIQIDDGKQTLRRNGKNMLSRDQVNEKFKIMNGIYFQTSKSYKNKIYYMEV